MGFGGAAAAMITSLKNNNRRNKREAFDGWSNSDTSSQGIKVAPVSEELLQEIRNKLKKQRKVLFRKRVLASCILVILILLILFFAVQ